MVKDVGGFLKFFSTGVQILSVNLMQCKHEAGEEEYTYEDAINSILDNFFPSNTNDRIKKYFIEEILLYHKNKEETRKQEFDASFFENGFSYYAIEDDNDHSLRSAIMMTSLDSTPEKILLELCKNSRVFGISATANYDTLIGNYALYNYIIPKLKDKYFEITEEKRLVLKHHFDKSISGYNKVNLNVKAISTDDSYNLGVWKEVFDNPEDCEEIYNLINQTLPSDGNDYHRNRYLRIAKVFKAFIENDNIKSFLCLLTAFPNTNAELKNEILQDIFDRLGKGNYRFNENTQILKSSNYERTKDKILEDLSAGKKLMVISTYQTIGAGQNLQYEIPKNQIDSVVQINEFPKSTKKDFDALYLDKPTNLLTMLQENSDEKDFTKYISQLEYLKESGEISMNKSRKWIADAFKYHYFKGKFTQLKTSDVLSHANYATKVLVQAVGRICRTNMKNPEIYIYYDSTISELLNPDMCRNNLLNPEFEALLKDAVKGKSLDKDLSHLKNRAETKSDYALTKIIKYVYDGRKGWREYAMEDWRIIRRFLLRHPTLSEEEFNKCDDRYAPFYIELPEPGNKLWFRRSDDFKELDISFTPINGYECVSSENAKLEKLLNIPEVKKLFEREHFATEFKENKYILCPPAFINIYKGALGEYCGKEILKAVGIQLEEITEPEFFELFDFRVKNSDIFVDFKHWNEYARYVFIPREEKYMSHVYEKLQKCNGKTALIINIFTAEDGFKMPDHANNGMRILEVSRLYNETRIEPDKAAFSKIEKIIRGSL